MIARLTAQSTKSNIELVANAYAKNKGPSPFSPQSEKSSDMEF
jgi:hypothetical protein